VTDPWADARRAAIRERAAQATARLRQLASPAGEPPAQAQKRPEPKPVPHAPSRPLDGRLRLPAFDSPAEIITDDAGVPHVNATSRADLYRAQGFLHFTERCWQIDVMARSGRGELASLMGPMGLASDSLIHQLRLPDRIEAAVSSAPQDVRQVMTWYAQGAQAALAQVPATAEHSALGHAPPRCDGHDALRDATAILLLFGLTLQHDWLLTLLRAAVEDGDAGSTVSGTPSAGQLLAALHVRLGPLTRAVGGGSNAWAVASARCATGGPVLAGDPHLMQQLPGPWMAMHLAGPGLDVIGATVPGVPDVLIGHNGRVAWSSAFAPAISTRLTLERIIDDGTAVQRPGGREPVDRSLHVIGIAGMAPATLQTTATSSGSLLGLDLTGADAERYDLAIDCDWWAEPYPQGVIAKVSDCTSAAELTAVLAGWRSFPQEVVYADAAGKVGTVQIGLKDADCPDSRPRYGWLPAPIRAPADSRCRVQSGEAIVVAANAAPADLSEPGHWEAPLRAGRVLELLSEGPRTPFARSVLAQLDVWSPLSARLLPRLAEAVDGHLHAEDARVLARLRQWHGHMYRDIPEPTIFAAWLRAVAEASAAPAGELAARWFVETKAWLTEWGLKRVTDWLDRCAAQPTGWRDIVSTFQAALGDLRDRLGPDYAEWPWGRCHQVVFRHALSGHPEWPAEPVRLALPGWEDTVCRGDGNRDAAVGPSFRMVVDLAHPDESVWAFPVGNSGVQTSPHYHDLATDWAQGRYHRMPYSRAAVRRAAAHNLSILPAERPHSKQRGGHHT
jgi:penicillin G amidase